MTDDAPTAGRSAAASPPRAETPLFAPAADIYETSDAFVLLLDMPGVAPDAVEVLLQARELTVRGRGKTAGAPGFKLAHAEYREGDYERRFELSETVDAERIAATMKDGVLRLTLPKTRPARARTITVQAV